MLLVEVRNANIPRTRRTGADGKGELLVSERKGWRRGRTGRRRGLGEDWRMEGVHSEAPGRTPRTSKLLVKPLPAQMIRL